VWGLRRGTHQNHPVIEYGVNDTAWVVPGKARPNPCRIANHPNFQEVLIHLTKYLGVL
jgi:hypothetical protein